MTPTDSATESFSRLHEDARRLLGDWSHRDPGQRVLRDQYLDFLQVHPDGMSRHCSVGHLTSSALVMNDSRSRVLLTLHPKVGRWLQLGGHNESGDASVRDAAHREAREESGIADVTIAAVPLRLDRHAVPCRGLPSEHLDVQYLAWVPDDAVAVISDESDDLRWFDLDALPEDLDTSVRALIDDALFCR